MKLYNLIRVGCLSDIRRKLARSGTHGILTGGESSGYIYNYKVMNGNLERKCLGGERTTVCEVGSSVHKTNAVFSTAVARGEGCFILRIYKVQYILRGCVLVIQSI